MSTTSTRIERLLSEENWSQARREIQRALRERPASHWLLSRLALTHYEQRRYGKALALERQALRLEPRCPLVLWGLAGSLEMLGRLKEAEAIYLGLLRRGGERLAHGTCGEGPRWARGLVADCWYRLGDIRARRGDRPGARAAYAKHLDVRRRGASIYSRRAALIRLRSVRGSSAQPPTSRC